MSEEFKQIYEMIKQCVDLKGTLKLNSICCNHILNYIKQLEQERDKYKSIVEEIKTELTKGITFCENDSQGHYDICNKAINREKKILDKIKELEEGNSNERK